MVPNGIRHGPRLSGEEGRDANQWLRTEHPAGESDEPASKGGKESPERRIPTEP